MSIEVEASAKLLSEEIRLRKQHKYAVFKIEYKNVVTDYVGDACITDTREDDKVQYDKLKTALLDIQEPRYVLYEFSFVAANGKKLSHLAFILWCSDDQHNARDTMLYSGAKNMVKKEFDVPMGSDYQANDASELDYDELANDVEGKLSR